MLLWVTCPLLLRCHLICGQWTPTEFILYSSYSVEDRVVHNVIFPLQTSSLVGKNWDRGWALWEALKKNHKINTIVILNLIQQYSRWYARTSQLWKGSTVTFKIQMMKLSLRQSVICPGKWVITCRAWCLSRHIWLQSLGTSMAPVLDSILPNT